MAINLRPGIDIVEKVWGEEEILVNNENYCGKFLHLMKGYRCSIHRHPKRETFYIQEGRVYLELEDEGQGPENMAEVELGSGEVIDIPRNAWHRFTGLEKSIIIEFSTPDTESERASQSEKVPEAEWKKLNERFARE